MENTTLSLKAQAVLGAAEDAYDYNYSEFHRCANSVAAATLRAAVKACAFEDFNTRLLTAADLLTIADELEAL